MFSPPIVLEIGRLALQEATRVGASFADVRLVWGRIEQVLQKNDRTLGPTTTSKVGFGVRVFVAGGWGYAVANTLNRHDVCVAARQAVHAAKVAALFGHDVGRMDFARATQGHYQTQVTTDPFSVPYAQKAELLTTLTDRISQKLKGAQARLAIAYRHQRKLYLSSAGAEIEQEQLWTGFAGEITVQGKDRPIRHSYLGGPLGAYRQAGWESIGARNLLAETDQLLTQTTEILSAEPLPLQSGRMPVVIGAEALTQYLAKMGEWFICSQPPQERREQRREPDRREADKDIFAAPCFSLVSDPKRAGDAGSIGFDDAGFEAKATTLVESGRRVGDSAEWAQSGFLRSEAGFGVLSPTASNLCLQPGSATAAELMSKIEHGVYVDGATTLCFEPHSGRFTAQSACAWEIRGGQKTRPVQAVILRGVLPRFWRNCEALADESSCLSWGGFQSGRPPVDLFDPVGVPISVRAPAAYFSEVEVGATFADLPAFVDGQAVPLFESRGRGRRRTRPKT